VASTLASPKWVISASISGLTPKKPSESVPVRDGLRSRPRLERYQRRQGINEVRGSPGRAAKLGASDTDSAHPGCGCGSAYVSPHEESRCQDCD
jgi:hypothetical protein